MTHTEFERMALHGYRLTTAEIMYHMPDFPKLLQTYIWQELDLAPKYPILHKFLNFWENELDGKLHSVKVGSCQLIKPSDFIHAQGEYILH